jgi:antitoxin CptB
MSEKEMDRLRWRCRRGLLELDLVLQSFLDNHYPKLSPAQRLVFARLLDTPDNTLWAYIQGSDIPSDTELNELIRIIR